MPFEPLKFLINQVKTAVGNLTSLKTPQPDVVTALNAHTDQINDLEDVDTALSNRITTLGPYNGLDSDSTAGALSAAQGKALNGKISNLGPINNLTSDSTTAALSAAQGKALNTKISNLGPYNGLNSTSTTAALSAAQGKVLNDKIPSVVNNLTSTSTTSALSAAQGKALNDKIPSVVNNVTSTSTTAALAAAQGKALNDKITAATTITSGTLTKGAGTLDVGRGQFVKKFGRIGILSLNFNPVGTSSAASSILVTSSIRPNAEYCGNVVASDGKTIPLMFRTDGTLIVDNAIVQSGAYYNGMIVFITNS